MIKYLAPVFLVLCLAAAAPAGLNADSKQVAAVESIYADVNDAQSIIGTIDSGLFAKHGGLFVLNELVHEDGHVINITAIRNRSAFVDWPSSLFAEAFADVPSWSSYEPAWQRRYLGRDTPEQVSLRALYSVVILDVAWSLFELRMLRTPSTDPNVLWTEITNHYLHIVPHPELSWWALRVQLADAPGYMVNYGLGAVLTAEMRQHIREVLGVRENPATTCECLARSRSGAIAR